MTLEKLKELLESGAITQEEFDDLAKTFEQDPPTDPVPVDGGIDYDKLEKIIQSRVDTQMAAERKKNAELKKRYENLQKAKMTDDELKQAELDERDKAIEERERAITEKENRMYAVKAIQKAGLNDGGDNALEIIDFVMGADESEIDARTKAFKALFDRMVAAEVDKRFKEGGRIPNAGTSLNGGKNPYMKNQWNLTEQMVIESTNPELAKQLQAAAGV